MSVCLCLVDEVRLTHDLFKFVIVDWLGDEFRHAGTQRFVFKDLFCEGGKTDDAWWFLVGLSIELADFDGGSWPVNIRHAVVHQDQ